MKTTFPFAKLVVGAAFVPLIAQFICLLSCSSVRKVPALPENSPGTAVSTPLEDLLPPRYVTVRPGVVLRVFEFNPELRPALVYLHGDGASADFWLPQIRHFKGRYRQIVFDRADCGKSSLEDAEYPYSAAVDDLERLLKILKVHSFVLIGHSRGQELAATFFSRNPQGLLGLVSSGSALGVEPSAECRARAEADLQAHLSGRHNLNQLCREMVAPLLSQIAVTMEISVERAQQLMEFACAAWRPRAGLLGCTDRPLAEALMSVDRPMLQIDGADYRKGFDRQAGMQRYFKKTSLKLIAGAGHVPSLEQTRAFNAELDFFLKGVADRLAQPSVSKSFRRKLAIPPALDPAAEDAFVTAWGDRSHQPLAGESGRALK